MEKTETERADALLTAEKIVAWLKKKNPLEKYNWLSCDDCLVARYLKAKGFKRPRGVTIYHIDVKGGADRYFDIGGNEPWTYGAALRRAKSAIAAAR